ncbi:MAG: gliding motility lipoprotein GldD [Paludibacteraceae bacterium]|nr:gliding motility lipoprotein GldD [Paludibacteraceae bacterium]
MSMILSRRYISILKVVFLLLVFVGTCGCSKSSTPKEYGYFRIVTPEHTYDMLSQKTLSSSAMLPYTFSMNRAAVALSADSIHPLWINVHYPSIDATVHCSYLPIQNNLPQLLNDAQEFVYSHSVKATAIPEQEYVDSINHVYGMYYELEGNTATPIQFYLMDSTKHFFRAAVYINTIPNQDSLTPVIDFLKVDTRHLVESFRWR